MPALDSNMVILAEIRTKQTKKKASDVEIWRIKVTEAKPSLSAVLCHAHSFSPTIGTLSLISVLNADMKVFPHLVQPKGIGQQDTVSLQQQKNR